MCGRHRRVCTRADSEDLKQWKRKPVKLHNFHLEPEFSASVVAVTGHNVEVHELQGVIHICNFYLSLWVLLNVTSQGLHIFRQTTIRHVLAVWSLSIICFSLIEALSATGYLLRWIKCLFGGCLARPELTTRKSVSDNSSSYSLSSFFKSPNVCISHGRTTWLSGTKMV